MSEKTDDLLVRIRKAGYKIDAGTGSSEDHRLIMCASYAVVDGASVLGVNVEKAIALGFLEETDR